MATPTTYTYTQMVQYSYLLQQAIISSSISISVMYINTNDNQLMITFSDVLPSIDQTKLSNLLSTYSDTLSTQPSISSSGTPKIITNGTTYTVSDNTQVCYSNSIITNSGGIILTAGTGVLTYVN